MLYTRAAQRDTDVNDDLAQVQLRLQRLKSAISSQSKANFLYERDVRYLDGRIGLLIADRIAADERSDMMNKLEEQEDPVHGTMDDARKQRYSNLFYLLQSEPRHIATLCRLVSLSDMDTLLQTVMFSLYGNQYDEREEHLLLTMFQSVLWSQFESSTDFGSLLRANTPVSRMMTTYTRRGPGQVYLKQVLAPHINQILAQSALHLEINATKVYEELLEQNLVPSHVPYDQVALLALVQTTVQERCAKLVQLATPLLQSVVNSLDNVPYGIRWICKQIRSLTKRKFSQESEFSMCTLIGAFFFLRFLNPAIVAPQAYMLVDDTPSPQARRALTLVAKMLQTLVNNPSFNKDPAMQCVAPFFVENRPTMQRFLLDLGNVWDFYETLELDQYIALSKKDMKITISLNEIYQMHAMVATYLDTLAPTNDLNLRVLMHELGNAPSPVPAKQNYTFELPLFSRWETQIHGLTTTLMSENNMSQSDILYMETKSILVKLIRSMPHVAATRPIVLADVLANAKRSDDSVLREKGERAAGMLEELEELHVVDRGTQEMCLVDEIIAELEFLGNSRSELEVEVDSLQSVLTAINEHNVYLKSQLDTYKSYLCNIRVAAGTSKEGRTPTGLGLVSVGGKEVKSPRPQGNKQTHRFTYQQLDRAKLIRECRLPADRRDQTFFSIQSPMPGTFLISMYYKSRDEPVLEMDLKLDDMLEQQHRGVQYLDLDQVQLHLEGLHSLLNRLYTRPSRKW
ncbi:RasGAP protein [Malassezia vespertilionis]|uniref:Gap1p n=1 Tax=Malassezia vespertilionis TaxID=2020962 RepID=A0A2N1J8B0_9BASI|nr:RasGAP protein [Malassezia vespertilionis]PKI82801.1 Gap1p [Malassezia vespertilionis]WFD08167.1 RasGAP protein [Malassezia vespertilionis]